MSTGKICKIEHSEHILLRPDSYIGSVTPMEQKTWTLVDGSSGEVCRLAFENILYNQGFDKTFDEILVNAYDHTIRTRGTSKTVKTIKDSVDKDGLIEVENDGLGISIEMTDCSRSSRQQQSRRCWIDRGCDKAAKRNLAAETR